MIKTVVDAYDLSERNLTTRPNYYINTVPGNLKYFLLESSKFRYEHNGLPVRNCSAQTKICTRYAVCQFVHGLPSCMRYAVCQIVGSTQPANLYLVRGLPIFTWARGLPIWMWYAAYKFARDMRPANINVEHGLPICTWYVDCQFVCGLPMPAQCW